MNLGSGCPALPGLEAMSGSFDHGHTTRIVALEMLDIKNHPQSQPGIQPQDIADPEAPVIVLQNQTPAGYR